MPRKITFVKESGDEFGQWETWSFDQVSHCPTIEEKMLSIEDAQRIFDGERLH